MPVATESAVSPDTLKLSLFSLTCLVIANMIGAGVYTTSGFSLSDLGSPTRVIWAWAAGGLIAICGAIGYGVAAKQLQESGGEYLFLSRWLHPAAGCVAGWVSLLAGFSGATAFAAVTFETYLPVISLTKSIPKGIMASILVLSLTALHGFAQRGGVWTQNLAVAAKLILLSVVMIVTYNAAQTHGWLGESLPDASMSLDWGKFAGSLVWISMSYSGFNAAIYIAGEAKDAAVNVPRSMLWGTVIVTVFYLLLNAAFVFGPQPQQIVGKADVAAISVTEIAGSTCGLVLRIVILIGLFTSVSSLLMAGSRVIAKMAEDRVLPRWLSGQKTGATPAIICQSLISLVFVWSTSLTGMLSYLGMVLSLTAATTVATALWHFRTAIFLRGPSGLITAAAFFASTLYVAATLVISMVAGYHNPAQFAATAATMLFGVVYWGVFTRSQ